MTRQTGLLTSFLGLCLASAAMAQTANTLSDIRFTFNGAEHQITQTNRPDTGQSGRFFVPPESCSSVCIAPARVAFGVETIGEREVIAFVTGPVSNGSGLVLDARAPDARGQGFITTSVNVPASLLDADNPYRQDILAALGVESTDTGPGYANALPLVIYDDGPMTSDAPDLINALILAGYPPELISYYRGGVHFWTALGLSITTP